MRRLSEDRGAILRMAGNIAGSIVAAGASPGFAKEQALDMAIGIVRDLDARIAEEGLAPYVKPPPTAIPGSGEGGR